MTAPRIKFCGFTRAEDIAVAVSLGVDYLGLVFAPRSGRRLDVAQAAALRAGVPAGVGVVALLMDQSCDAVRAVVDGVSPDLLQFHGGEDDAFCASFGLPFWKAIAMGGDPRAALQRLPAYPSASAFLFDGHAAGEQGGSGQRFDWRVLGQGLSRPFLLAGGLDAGNVATAMRIASPWGLDLSSGIESAPGIKDAAKMRAFVEAVRRADAENAARIV